MEHVEVLPLVFVEALDVNVEEARGVDGDAGARRDLSRERFLVLPLDAPPLLAKRGVAGEGFECADQLEVMRPRLANRLRDEFRLPGIDQHDEPARRHAVRHIPDLRGPELVKITQKVASQQIAVERGHAVDRVAADAGEVRHAHRPLA